MFALSNEEKQAALFLAAVIIVGVTLNFVLKLNQDFKKTVFPSQEQVKIDLNKASLADFSSCRCLSQHLSENIISYRQEHGDFSSFEELKKVKGIGDVRYEKLKKVFFVR
ncbi:MAG: helix-hairpin-helix domain-containing protein [Candidatus Omnitrophica bacterium]|jgi:competence protein ComEA|nr:helix-hairpin-helix domain-containing protein [Candidatus Omnitrophota bacterium]